MKKTVLGILVAALAAFASAGSARAAGTWAQNHPRQHQVLSRSRRQQRRANRMYKRGKISRQQRNHIDGHERNIRRTDRRDARQNGGFISKGQDAGLNGRENNNGQHMNNPAGGPPAAQ